MSANISNLSNPVGLGFTQSYNSFIIPINNVVIAATQFGTMKDKNNIIIADTIKCKIKSERTFNHSDILLITC